jgi:hypothetical protein
LGERVSANSQLCALTRNKREIFMKIVIIHPPKFLTPIIARLFGIKIKR